MKLNEIGIKTFQELVYFIRAALQRFFSWSVTFYFFEKDGEFHVCTCGNLPGMGEQNRIVKLHRIEVEHSKLGRARQSKLRIL